ncbi:MAG: tRNA (guanosine(37)-N1)-methyltransferase TrmD [Anaerolineae bacterium]|nr:MAG: tRNA (guanosine(37)-N1)-methyltransferase TrmD [Anaerolineae bacterium]
MQIDVLTLFPEVFPAYLNSSIVGRILSKGLIKINIHNIRDFASGKHRITDEPPFGGGGGMVLKPDPIFAAVEHLTNLKQGTIDSNLETNVISEPVVLLTPQGQRFNHKIARRMAGEKRLILICGRYEGVDERVRQHLVNEEISIGDYVLTGGELAALVVIDAVSRLLPGALGAEDAVDLDSYSEGLLEGPHYTRPAYYRGWPVPDALRSGHAANIERWRREESLRRTWQRRPDLLIEADLDEDDKAFLAELAEERIDEIVDGPEVA